MLLSQRSLRRFPDDGVCLHQQIVQGLSLVKTLLEFYRLPRSSSSDSFSMSDSKAKIPSTWGCIRFNSLALCEPKIFSKNANYVNLQLYVPVLLSILSLIKYRRNLFLKLCRIFSLQAYGKGYWRRCVPA